MKVLLVGSLPPPVTERSLSLLGAVLHYRREGASVRVLSPSGESVAHEYLALSGPAAALEIGRAARAADTVVLQLEPGLVVGETPSRAGRAVSLGSLAVALRAARGVVVVRVHSLDDMPLGFGGRAAERLFAVAERIEVGSEEVREVLSAALGPELATRIAIADPPAEIGSSRGGRADVGADADLETASALVRARAASERASVLAAARAGGGERLALVEWVPRPGAGVPAFASAASTRQPEGSAARRAARAALLAAEAWRPTRPLARGVRATRRALAKV